MPHLSFAENIRFWSARPIPLVELELELRNLARIRAPYCAR